MRARMLAAAVFIVLALCPAVTSAQSEALDKAYDAGRRAVLMGDYATALEQLGKAAEQGNPKAQFELGLMHERGRGVPKNAACSAPGSLDTSLSHAAGLIEIAAWHA